MAGFQNLLLSAGGGVVSPAQQVTQSREATLFIGLGGTGIDCLRAIKQKMHDHLLPDDPDADTPEYSHIKFLAVDSDKFVTGDPYRECSAISDQEFFSIADAIPFAAVKGMPGVIEAKPELNWLRYEDINVPAMGVGTGGIRQMGRYLLMERSSAFVSRVTSLASQAMAGLYAASVNIHIFAGLGGGTGSGTFLDVCYLVQEVLRQIGAVGNSKIYGYFFLPDVNLSRIPYPSVREYIQVNGYAALKELDYCMQLERNGGAFTQQYQDERKIVWKNAPVDFCHLVSATDSHGRMEQDGYTHAMNAVADCAMEFLTHTAGFSPAAHLDCFAFAAAQVPKNHGACNRYFILGAASAQVPLKEINTYLASALFERFSVVKGRVPSGKDVSDLANEVGLVYENLYRVVKDAAGGDFSPSGVTAKEVKQMGSRAIEQHYEKQRDSMMGKIETKVRALMDPKNEDSCVGKLRRALDNRVRDIRYGPFFVSQILNTAQEQNLLNVINGFICSNTERLTYETNQSDLMWNEYNHACEVLSRGRVLFFRQDVQAYENALLNLSLHQVELLVFQQLQTLLAALRDQVLELYVNFYSVLARVFGCLEDTFAQNKEYLEQRNTAPENPYGMPLMTMEQIRPTLERHVEEMNVDSMLGQFMGYLLANSEAWLGGDERKISRLVTNFLVNAACKDFSFRTITSYLQERYHTTDVGVLQQKVYSDYMQPLMQKAAPLFWNNPTYFDPSGSGKMGYVSVPMTANAIDKAGDDLVNNMQTEGISKSISSREDSFGITRRYFGIPLYAYQSVLEMEKRYQNCYSVGVHLYEGKPQPEDGNPVWDWRTLPSVVPQSLCGQSMPEQVQEDVSEGRTLFAAAVESGLIQPVSADSGTLQLFRWSDAYLEQVDALMIKGEHDVKIGDVINGGMLKTELEKLLADPQIVPTGFTISCDAVGVSTPQIKQNMLCDYFVSSPVFRREVQNILEQNQRAKALLRSLMDMAAAKEQQIGSEDALFFDVDVNAPQMPIISDAKSGVSEAADE